MSNSIRTRGSGSPGSSWVFPSSWLPAVAVRPRRRPPWPRPPWPRRPWPRRPWRRPPRPRPRPRPRPPPCPSTPTSTPARSPAAGPARRSATSRWASRCPFVELVSDGIKEQANDRRRGARLLRLQARRPDGARLRAAVRGPGRPGRPELPGRPEGLAPDLRRLRQRADDRHRHHPAALPGRLHGRQQPRGRPHRRCGHGQVRQGDLGLRLHGVRLAGVDRRQGRQRRPHGRLSATASQEYCPIINEKDPAGRRPHRPGARARWPTC